MSNHAATDGVATRGPASDGWPGDKATIEEVVYRSCLLLDDGDYEGYLALCAPEFCYRIEAYSPEIRREMVWLEHDLAGMAALFRQLPRHNSDRSPLTRHLTVYTVRPAEGRRDHVSVISALQVFRTALDGGSTALYVVGKVYDVVRLQSAQPLLARRVVRLDTRDLGIGNHLPL